MARCVALFFAAVLLLDSPCAVLSQPPLLSRQREEEQPSAPARALPEAAPARNLPADKKTVSFSLGPKDAKDAPSRKETEVDKPQDIFHLGGVGKGLPKPKPIDPMMVAGPLMGLAGAGAVAGTIAVSVMNAKKEAEKLHPSMKKSAPASFKKADGKGQPPPAHFKWGLPKWGQAAGAATTPLPMEKVGGSANATYYNNTNVTATPTVILGAATGAAGPVDDGSSASSAQESSSSTVGMWLLLILLTCCCFVAIAGGVSFFISKGKKKNRGASGRGRQDMQDMVNVQDSKDTEPLMDRRWTEAQTKQLQERADMQSNYACQSQYEPMQQGPEMVSQYATPTAMNLPPPPPPAARGASFGGAAQAGIPMQTMPPPPGWRPPQTFQVGSSPLAQNTVHSVQRMGQQALPTQQSQFM